MGGEDAVQLVHRSEAERLADSGVYFPDINLAGREGFEIVRQFATVYHGRQLLPILQAFHKGISDINLQSCHYKMERAGETLTLPLHCLGPGERLFALCFMADRMDIPIVVQNECEQLEPEQMKQFLARWYKSPNIHVIFNQMPLLRRAESILEALEP